MSCKHYVILKRVLMNERESKFETYVKDKVAQWLEY
jgi:hypothetical protein